MPHRADAHIHLMSNANQGLSFADRPGIKIDEVSLYSDFIEAHDIVAALIVGYEGWTSLGYEGGPHSATNNNFIARMATIHQWVRPVAYIEPQNVNIPAMEQFKKQKFYGISMYHSDDQRTEALQAIGDEVWQWIAEHRWLISINSQGDHWAAWQPILQRHGELHVLASHLGLPPRVKEPPTSQEAIDAMAHITAMASFPGTRVKLSGFYALSDPGHDYPHRAAWPYVEVLVDHFGVDRLLWGSDCTPSLNTLTMPQTIDLFAKMPFLTSDDRAKIEGQNLLALLDAVVRD